MTTPRGFRDRANDSLFELIGEVPELVRNLVVAEIDSAKAWLARTSKDAGIGVVWFVAALFFLFWSVAALGAFMILGLASWIPAWLAALLVFVALLLIAGVLALLGVLRLRKIKDSEDPVTAVKEDAVMWKETLDEL